MGKVAKILPEEYKEKAIENDIPIQTVYNRLDRGWELEKAVTTKPRQTRRKFKREETGEIKATDRPTGKTFSVILHQDMEDKFLEAVEKSGLPRSTFARQIIENYLEENGKKSKKNTCSSSRIKAAAK